jgi:hypothetical protein
MLFQNVQAHGGDHVADIHKAAAASTKYQPNIIVLNAGTNDCVQSDDIPNFGTRYNSLLDYLYDEIPNVTIIVSIVLQGTANGIPQNRDSANAQIRALVADRRNNKNQRIVLADFDDPPGFFTTQYLVADGTHPNDEGHRRLAAIFLRAIEEANDAGFIVAPTDTGMSDESGGTDSGDNTCDKVFGSGASHGPVNTQSGIGLDDGIYAHNSIDQGVRFSVDYFEELTFDFARLGERFGNHDIVSGGAIDDSTKYRSYTMWSNLGGGWSPPDDPRTFYLEDTCGVDGVDIVYWVDVNGKLIILNI